MPGPHLDQAHLLEVAERCLARYGRRLDAERAIAAELGCSRTTAGNAIRTMRAIWEAESRWSSDPEHRLALRGQFRQRYQEIYTRAMETDDLKSALRALDRLCQIDGVDTNVVPEHVTNILVQLSPDQKAKLVDPDQRREEYLRLVGAEKEPAP